MLVEVSDYVAKQLNRDLITVPNMNRITPIQSVKVYKTTNELELGNLILPGDLYSQCHQKEKV
jgi:hypothetical protein